jgi:N-acetylneuraminic acid mutarotase
MVYHRYLRFARAGVAALVISTGSLLTGHAMLIHGTTQSHGRTLLATSPLSYSGWDTSVTTVPSALARPAVASGHDNNIYVFGGTNSGTEVSTTFIYHPHTNTWSLGANMPVAREGAQAVTLPDGRIAVLGGGTRCSGTNLCNNGTVYNRVDVYTPGSNTWRTLAPMLVPRYRFAAVLYKGQILAIGGSNGSSAIASVEVYNRAKNTWSTIESLPQVTEAPQAAVDPHNGVYVAGGFDGNAGVYNTVYGYTGTAWSGGPSLLQSTFDGGATFGADGRLWVVGGFNNGYLTSVQVYDPGSQTWSWGPSLPNPTCCMGVVTTANGDIYSIGGAGNVGNIVAIYHTGPATRPQPIAPALTVTLPGQNAILTGPTLPFRWHAYPHAAYYDLQIWLVQSFGKQRLSVSSVTNYATRLSGTSYALSVHAMPKGIYHWRMAAVDVQGTLISSWTPEATVTIP